MKYILTIMALTFTTCSVFANFVSFQANSNKGTLLLFNGIDHLLLVDGTSKLCLSNGC